MNTIAANKEKAAQLQAELDKTLIEIEKQEDLRKNDPIDYLGRLVLANKVRSGSYGYDYSEYGESERERAAKVLEVVKGYVDIAADVITTFHIR